MFHFHSGHKAETFTVALIVIRFSQNKSKNVRTAKQSCFGCSGKICIHVVYYKIYKYVSGVSGESLRHTVIQRIISGEWFYKSKV